MPPRQRRRGLGLARDPRYFSSATQIGLTATPKETEYVSNIAYFGEPVFTYSLKQGIRDGFLAPYKVVKVHIDRDVEGYRPEKGQLDRDGNEVEDRIYNAKDFDRTLVIDDRTKLVAKKVTQFLKESGDRYQKTIVFCVDQEHAARMRQALINENADLVAENPRYVMRITGSDAEGQASSATSSTRNRSGPVIVTTSRLLSTGVDAQTCRLIVLDREVGSMTEFKQIVGRGTRVHEDTQKYYFTLIDFRGATSHFADPDFDGEPVQIYEPGADDPMTRPTTRRNARRGRRSRRRPARTRPSSISRACRCRHGRAACARSTSMASAPRIVAERVEYLDENGKLVTESLRDFTKRALRKRFASLDDFLKRWNAAERKQAIIEELEAEGLPLDAIARSWASDLDPFDLICHVAFDAKPLTRRERAENVKKRDAFTKYGDKARAVLDALLAKVRRRGRAEPRRRQRAQDAPFTTIGTPIELIRAFGGKAGFEQAVHDLQSALYQETA
jgi:type I restriction enzyme, R subunit